MTISGSDIVELERSFFVTNDAKIPYHRIKLIRYREKVLFDLQKASLGDDVCQKYRNRGRGF